MKCWHIQDSTDLISLLLKAFSGKAYIDYTGLKQTLAKKIKLKKDEQERKPGREIRGSDDAVLSPLTGKAREDIAKFTDRLLTRGSLPGRGPSTGCRMY